MLSSYDNPIMIKMHISDDQILREIPQRRETGVDSEKMAQSSKNNSAKQFKNYRNRADSKPRPTQFTQSNKNKGDNDQLNTSNQKGNASDYMDNEQFRQSSFFIESPAKRSSFAYTIGQNKGQQPEQFTFSNHPSLLEDGLKQKKANGYKEQIKKPLVVVKQNSQILEVNENTTNQRDFTANSKLTQNLSDAYQLRSIKNREGSIIRFIKSNVQSFMNKMTVFGKTRLLSSQIRKQIGDIADFFEDTQITYNSPQSTGALFKPAIKKTAFDSFKKMGIVQKFHQISKKITSIILDENSLSLQTLTLLIFLWNIFYLYFSSVQIIFDALTVFSLKNTLIVIAIIIWLVDIMLQIVMISFQQNELEENKYSLHTNIIKKKLYIDIIPIVFEIIYLNSQSNSNLIRLPIFLKIFSMSIVLQKIELIFLKRLQNRYFVVELIIFFLKLFLFFHLIATVYYIISLLQSYSLDRNFTWFEINNEAIERDFEKYLAALQWAILYGKISQNRFGMNDELQLFLSQVWSVFSLLLFAYIIASVKNILKHYFSSSLTFQQDLKVLCKYSCHNQFSISFLKEVKDDMYRKFQQKQDDDILLEHSILSKLNKPLQQKLINQSKVQIIKKYPCFWQRLSKRITSQMPNIMQSELFNEGTLIEPLFQVDCYFYLLLQGQAEIIQKSHFQNPQYLPVSLKQNDLSKMVKGYSQIDEVSSNNSEIFAYEQQYHIERPVRIIESGDFFGSAEIITGIKQNYTVKCTKNSMFLKIKRSDLLEIIKKNERDYQIFMEMKDRIVNSQRYSLLDEKCFHCNQKDHIFSNCMMVNQDRTSSFAFMKSVQSQEQTRNLNYARKKIQKTQFIYIEGDDDQSQSNDTIEDSVERINSAKDQISINTNLINQQHSIEDNALVEHQIVISQHSINNSSLQTPQIKQRISQSYYSYKNDTADGRSDNFLAAPSVEDGVSFQSELNRDASSRTLGEKTRQSRLSINTPLKRYSESTFTAKEAIPQDTVSTKNEKLEILYPSSIQNSSLIDYNTDKRLKQSQFAIRKKNASVGWKEVTNYGSLKNLNFNINQTIQALDTSSEKWKFDMIKEFKYYFPQHNISHILFRFRTNQIRKNIFHQKRIKKMSLFESSHNYS